MNGQAQATPPGGKPAAARVSKPWLKFLIGFVGGFCAAIFPRLMAALALYGSSKLVLVNTGYVGIAVLFAALVGTVVMIMEWGIPREPRATFMASLGIPALLAGALNTSNGVYALDNQARVNSEMASSLQDISRITDITPGKIVPLSDAGSTTGQTHSLALFGIGLAYAGDGTSAPTGLDLNPMIQVQQKQYFIVLWQARNEAEARQEAMHLKSAVPEAKAVKAGDQFLVIKAKQMPLDKALLDAIKLKTRLGLEPKLLRVK